MSSQDSSRCDAIPDTNPVPCTLCRGLCGVQFALADSSAKRRVLSSTTQYWTHPSISAIGDESDPIHFITESARDLVYRAIESGWQGPPFDPFQLANFAGIKVLPHIINAAVFTSAFSASNSALYSASRVLFALSIRGQAPKIFSHVTKSGLPLISISFCVGPLAYSVSVGRELNERKHSRRSLS